MCRELILPCWTGNLSDSQVLWPTMVAAVENQIKQEQQTNNNKEKKIPIKLWQNKEKFNFCSKNCAII
jgi:hypothetical protein